MQRHMKKKEYHKLVPYFWTPLTHSFYFLFIYPSVFIIYISSYLIMINLSALSFF